MPELSVPLADLFDIQTRFRRSVHLERDAAREDVLDGYVVTPLALKTLHRIVDGLSLDGGQRAWSLTGPYGSGKSAFSTFLYALLSDANPKAHRKAMSLLKAADAGLAKELSGRKQSLLKRGGLVPVIATGERGPLELLLLRALERGLADFWSGGGRKPQVLHAVSKALNRAQKGKTIATGELVELFENAAEAVGASSASGCGLVVIVDELGKHLEHAALSPKDADLYALQLLAEASTRSGDAPILFLTTLHQGFDRYASRLGATQRNEWTKVQGRFEDIAFQEAPEQLIRLCGNAIKSGSSSSWSREGFDALATKGASLAVSVMGLPEDELAELLAATAPLHPSTSLILGPAFRGLASQNERSLFAFLSSAEPFGFQAYLRNTSHDDVTGYRIADLYDYLAANVGGGLEAGPQGRRWALVEEALGRLNPDSSPLHARVLKTIGLLNIIGSHAGVTPSTEFVAFALDRDQGVKAKDVKNALADLVESRHLVFRKYKNAYQLWDGSDLNVEALLETARGKVLQTQDVAQELQRLYPPRQLVAKRHLFETGTLRYFEVVYSDGKAVRTGDRPELQRLPSEADGLLIYAIPDTDEEAAELREKLAGDTPWLTLKQDHPVVVAVPDSISQIREALADLSAVEIVRRETSALDGDPVARRELSARQDEAQAFLTLQMEEMFGLARKTSDAKCTFFYRTASATNAATLSPRGLSDLASRLCDDCYTGAPRVFNELINRRQISSAAAGARRLLIEAMVERSEEPELLLEGAPPEKAMYLSVIAAHGLHKETDAGWALVPPPNKEEGFGPAWAHIEQRLAGEDGKRVPVSTIFDELRRPPFGMKGGPLPVLMATVLLVLDSEISLYEEGAFVPKPTSAVLERLARFPDRFAVQGSKIDGARAKVFERLSTAYFGEKARGRNQLARLVKKFAIFVDQLPPYARQTKRLTEQTLQVREALVTAKEPADLVFRNLPEACGLKPFERSKQRSGNDVDAYLAAIQISFDELDSAYSNLKRESLERIGKAFGIPRALGPMRAALVERAQLLKDVAGDAKLKSFIVNTLADGLDDDLWLDALLTNLGRRPPTNWTDPDHEAFTARLALVAQSFKNFEHLAVELDEVGADFTDALRISITRRGAAETATVARLRRKDAAKVASVEDELMRTLAAHGLGDRADLAVLALGRLAHRLLSDETDTDGRGTSAHG